MIERAMLAFACVAITTATTQAQSRRALPTQTRIGNAYQQNQTESFGRNETFGATVSPNRVSPYQVSPYQVSPYQSYRVPSYQPGYYGYGNSYYGSSYPYYNSPVYPSGAYGYPAYGNGYYPSYRVYQGPTVPSGSRSTTGGSHYFGDPHASQYFGR